MQALTEAEETVGGYLTSWLQHSKTRVRAKTHEGYEGLVRLYARPGIGDIPLGSLSPLTFNGSTRTFSLILNDTSPPVRC